jgi:dihydroorotase-like cyclic amidohydrolase
MPGQPRLLLRGGFAFNDERRTFERLDILCRDGQVAEIGEDLRTGLAADILGLRTDPLTDLAVLARDGDRRAVIQGGRIVGSNP